MKTTSGPHDRGPATGPLAASYDRELEWSEPPSPPESSYARWTVVRAAGPPAPAWLPLGRLGAVDLYLAPPGAEADAPALSVEPVVARKRGSRDGGDYVGVDGHVCLPAFDDDGGPLPDGPAPRVLTFVPSSGAGEDDDGALRIAVVDVNFDKPEALDDLLREGATVEGPYVVGLPTGETRAVGSPLGRVPGHGTGMAGILLAHVGAPATLGLFQIPSVAGAVPPYLAAADLSAALAAAVGAWRADVVLIAMSDGAWGTPRHLREMLREAARTGRGGRGAAIFCSVGDPSRNHVRDVDSVALGADDLCSQPWVQAVAACDPDGRWYRTYPDYRTGKSAAYNRLGPAVALSAPGHPLRHGSAIAADDSSQAAALAAAAAARVLRENRDLTEPELRALLALTAEVPVAVDGGRGIGADGFDARDRLGHSFKIGYGVVSARAACLAAVDPICLALLATREVPDPVDGPSVALRMADAWNGAVQAEARRAKAAPPPQHIAGGAGPFEGPASDATGGALARDYLQVRPRLSRLFLQSLGFKEALLWLARHVRALCEAGDGSWWAPGQDHGALVERIRHAAERARDALPVDDPSARWARRLETTLADPRAAAVVGGFAGAFLATSFSPVRRTGGVERAVSRLKDEGSRGQS